ncbi:pili assembly chaperone [Klebsiella pneumoniae]|nr:pili assembly chaperone [Klebsiella pneumoniae]
MRYPFFAIGLLLSSSFAQASVVVGGTRLVFDGTKNNAVITVENKDQNSNIVQSWLSVIDAASPAKDAFIITPPLGNDSNLLIVFYVQIMPDDLVMQLHRF